jgi:predicted acyl esterase
MGNTAEIAAASKQSALRAVPPLYNDFDLMLGWARPGGVLDVGAMEPWSEYVAMRDRNDVCACSVGPRCWYHRLLTPGVKPVDGDPSGAHLALILSRRHNPPAIQSFGKPEFRDGGITTMKGSGSLDQITPYSLRARIEASDVPMMVCCSWLDAGTCDRSLSRFLN